MLGGLLTSAEREHVTEGLQQPADPGTEKERMKLHQSFTAKKVERWGKTFFLILWGYFEDMVTLVV